MTNDNYKYSTLKNIVKNTPKYFYEKFSGYQNNSFNFSNSGGLRKNGNYKISKNGKPLITIITVCYNSELFIEKTIKSVLAQSYDNIEYIIIDGNSKDKTLQIIRNYEQYLDYWISDIDTGIYDAINRGILLSSGEIIGILNSDDLYTNDALTIVKNYFVNNNIDFLFGTVKKDRLLSGFNSNKISWKFNIFPAHSSGFFISQKGQIKVGLYDQQFKLHADYDLIYRLISKCKLNGLATKKEELIGIFNIEGISSKESAYRYFWEEFKIRKKNKQNFIFLVFLTIIKILHYYMSKFKFFKKIFFLLRKKINY